MDIQVQGWQAVTADEAQLEENGSQMRFTQIYEALLNNKDLIEPELVELGRLVAKRLVACQQRRRAATTVVMKDPVSDLSAWQY
jgi:hypothetical protein